MTCFFLSPAFRTTLALALAAPLWLVACRQASEPDNDAMPANVVAMKEEGRAASAPVSVVPENVAPPATLAIAPTDAAVPDRSSLTPEAAKGEKGARAVLLDWARALERGDWASARAQWGHGGEDSGLDSQAFAQSYQKYQSITVAIGDGMVEGRAGSLYYQVPVTLTGRLRDGRSVRLNGPVTVRRVNDVDGASAEELAWHIAQSDLKPRP